MAPFPCKPTGALGKEHRQFFDDEYRIKSTSEVHPEGLYQVHILVPIPHLVHSSINTVHVFRCQIMHAVMHACDHTI